MANGIKADESGVWANVKPQCLMVLILLQDAKIVKLGYIATR
jgi:hypothetical protein